MNQSNPMTQAEYDNAKQELEHLTNLSTAKKESYFRYMTLIVSSTLGILISLSDMSHEHLYIRLVFLLTIVLFALALIANSVVIYDFQETAERARLAHWEETYNSLKEHRKMGSIKLDYLSRTTFCISASYVLWLLALISLVAYAVLKTFA